MFTEKAYHDKSCGAISVIQEIACTLPFGAAPPHRACNETPRPPLGPLSDAAQRMTGRHSMSLLLIILLVVLLSGGGFWGYNSYGRGGGGGGLGLILLVLVVLFLFGGLGGHYYGHYY